MDLAAIEQWAVPIAAAWGAGLSTLSVILKRWEDKPKIRIDYDNLDQEDIYHEVYIVLIVRNFGKKSVTLSYAYVEEISQRSIKQKILNKLCRKHELGEESDYTDRCNGIEIISGKNGVIPILIHEIPTMWIKNKINLRGVVVDQLGNEYRSKVIQMYQYPFP